ncbi:unnamed protein product [Dibothriocephalus latus]|uniref:Uncharacterized protein n=1 Tax=Dibothriocephalus latus TaxID=60516 RepID=A0A3P7M771_DIBLA|nr:unnamed protein product [Dibothriocephalus latus]
MTSPTLVDCNDNWRLLPSHVFYGTVVAQEIHGDSARLAVVVHNVWRTKGPAAAYLPMELRHGQNKISAWIPLTRQPDESPDCFCPRLEVDHSYLFISKASEVSL